MRFYLPTVIALGVLTACGGGDQAGTPSADQTPQSPEPAATQEPAAPAISAPPARAELINREGQEVGEVTFTQDGADVVIEINGRNFEGGPKGVHIHEVGICEPPSFESAGAHFNPDNRQHGLENPNGPHAGDLPNVVIDPDDGLAHANFQTPRVTLVDGQPNSLFDADGSSIIIHVGPDDGTSQPAGGSGDRIVCGVIERV